MRSGLLLPLVMLAGAAVAAVFVLVLSRRQRLIVQRLEAAVPAGAIVAGTADSAPTLRMRQQHSSRLIPLALFLKVPLDLPLANIIAPGIVFAVAAVAAVAAGWAVHFVVSWVWSSVFGIVLWVILLRLIFGWQLARYQAKLVRQLPDTVQLVISATRAGLPVSAAFQAVADEMPSPTRDEFVRIGNEMTLGLPAEEALLNMHRRTGVTEYAIFAVTIGVQSRSGGRLAETVQNLADTVRERLVIAARARALAGEAKLSATIMGILPLITGVLLAFTDPGHFDLLFHDPRGQRLLAFGFLSLLLGVFTMRQLIRGATSG